MIDERRRPSLRWQNYNYIWSGAHFITIAMGERSCLPGEISEDEMWLNIYDSMVYVAWQAVPDHFPDVFLNEFVVMSEIHPRDNHINDPPDVDTVFIVKQEPAENQGQRDAVS